MDTRSKIIPAARRDLARPLTVVTAYFDPLLAWHARELEAVRKRAACVAAIVPPIANELLPQRARAELAASLRMIDYVLTANSGDLDSLIAEFQPDEIVRMEAQEVRRRGELIEHVHRRHKR